MSAPRRTHRHPVHRLAQHGRQLGRVEHRADLARRHAQAVEERRQRAPVGLVPQPGAAQHLARRREPIELFGKRRFAFHHQRCQDRLDLGPPVGEVFVPRHGAQRLQPRLAPRPAQRQLERPRALEPGRTALARPDQRVLEQRHQRDRRRALGGHFRQEQQHPTRRGLRQRPPRRVVRLDVPPPQVLHDTRGKPAVGRDHCNALFGHLERLPHEQRDRLRLLFGIGGFHQPHAGQPPPLGRQIDPRSACLGWQEQARDRVAAFWRSLAETRAVPRLHFVARDPQPVEQQLQVVLRVRHRVVAPDRRVGIARARRAELVPRLGGQRQVEVGKHHRAGRHPRDPPQQRRQPLRGAGDPGRHDRRFGRRLAPALCGMAEKLVEPVGRVDFAARLQLREPTILHRNEQPQPALPVIGEIAEQPEDALLPKLLGPDLLDQQPVHRPRHFLGEPQQRRPLQVGPLVADQLRQPQPAVGHVYRRRDLRPRPKRVEQRSERLVEVEIADHRHPRHQQSLSRGRRRALARVPDERLGHRADRAPARQQQRQPGQPEIGLGVARHEPGHERIGKPAVRGDRVDFRASGLSHRPVPPRSGGSPRACRPRTTAR